ncbi:MAG: CAP domain-containing protein [Patescibacteria group bacterium]
MAGIVLCLFFVVPLSASSQTVDEHLIREIINRQRAEKNLQPLGSNAALGAAALLKAEDMQAKSYFAHESPDGRMPWDFIDPIAYPYEYAGENLALDYDDPAEVVAAWLESPTHRDNVLNPNFSHLGLATSTVDGKTAIVLLLGSAPVADGHADGSNTAQTDAISNSQGTNTPVLSIPIISDNATPEKRAVAGRYYAGNEPEIGSRTHQKTSLPYILFTAYTVWLAGVCLAIKNEQYELPKPVKK